MSDLRKLHSDVRQYPNDIEARKQVFLECVLRRAILQKEGWDDEMLNEATTDIKKEGVTDDARARELAAERKAHREDLRTWTICELCHYKEHPDIKRSLWYRVSERPIPPTGADHDLYQGLARVELALKNPSRAESLFGAQFNADEYWMKFSQEERDMPESFPHMTYLKDTADFGANYKLRILYLYDEVPKHISAAALVWRELPGDRLASDWLETRKVRLARNRYFSAQFAEQLKEKFLGFKFWLDEPFFAAADVKKTTPAVDDALSAISPIDIDISAAAISNDNLRRARRDFEIKINARDKKPIDDVKDVEKHEYEMVYWSENHQILFATAEYLAGQWWAEEVFRAGRDYRDLGPDSHRDGDITGAEHMEKAKPRIMRWLSDRLRFGFCEFGSSVYYQEDFNALFNLTDFCLDQEIQTRACMVLDLLIFELARFNHQGSFGVVAGRNYGDQKQCGWNQSTGDLQEILFGSRNGAFREASHVAGSLASSRRYQVPAVLISIGQHVPERMIDRSRVSFNFDEAKKYGVGFSSDEDVISWWGKGAFFPKQVIDGTRNLVEKYGLKSTSVFEKVMPALDALGWGLSASKIGGLAALAKITPMSLGIFGNPFSSQSYEVADALSVLTEGSSLTRANIYTYRNKDAMLSSVQNFRPGQMNFQSHVCQATLSMNASVWTTHPSGGVGLSEDFLDIVFGMLGTIAGATAGGFIGAALGAPIGFLGRSIIAPKDVHFLPASDDGPSWWTGTVTLPRVVQVNNAAIIAYKPKLFQVLFSGGRTHAWFPKKAFDPDVQDPEIPSLTPIPANCNIGSATWWFGRKDNGYVALLSAQGGIWTDDGDWADKEIIADGDRNVFIIQVGNVDEYGSYDNFKRRVASARVHINGLHWPLSDFQCSYDIPVPGGGNERLELHYDEGEDQVRLSGQPFEDSSHPRFENKYIKGGRVLWDQYHYTIEWRQYSLTHDFRDINDPNGRSTRSVGSRERAPKLIEMLTCQPQKRLDDRGTSDSPSLAVAGSTNFFEDERPLMAWKGAGDDQRLFWSSFEGGGWSGQQQVPGMRSSHGPAIVGMNSGEKATGLLMVWKGEDEDSQIYFSTNRTLEAGGWSKLLKVPDATTSTRPALAQFGDKIAMAWKGQEEEDSSVHYAFFDGRSWSPIRKVKGIGTDSHPSLVTQGGRLFMAWKGIEDDPQLYFSSLADVTRDWEPQRRIDFPDIAGKTYKASSNVGLTLAAVNSSLLASWKGEGEDNRIWFATFEDGAWTRQVSIKGVATEVAPAAVGFKKDIVLTWKGIEDDSAIYFTIFDTSEFSGTGTFFSWG